MRRLFVAISTLLVAAASWGANYESVTFTAIQPVQTTNYALGTTLQHTFSVSGYKLGRVYFTGTLTEINGTTADFGSENRIQVETPYGETRNVQVTTTTGYTGLLSFAGSFFVGKDYAMPMQCRPWTFRYINTVDDTPTGGVPDAELTITFTMSDDPPTPPAAGMLPLANPAQPDPIPGATASIPLGPGGIGWFQFEIPEGAAGAKYLDITTDGSTGFTDTEIGIYNACGDLIANDDDDGPGNFSQLSFGNAAARPAIGTGLSRNNQDGTLQPGVYYVAVAGFNAAFAGNFGVTTSSTASGTIVANIRTNIAESLGSLSGNVRLDCWTNSYDGQPVLIEIESGGVGIFRRVVLMNALGDFSFKLPGDWVGGTYDVTAKYPASLRRRLLSVTIPATGTSGLQWVLDMGDITNDNNIDSDDFDQLVLQFGVCGPADLTGDLAVDSDDFDCLVLNFGKSGD